MPFKPLTTVDEERFQAAVKALCETFGLERLYPHQEEVGRNMLLGKNTILDIPTGGGKTIAFWLALFYFWTPGNIEEACHKIILVIGPLTGLMASQAKTLTEKGIPAVAITSGSPDKANLIRDVGKNKYRIIFVGPETARLPEFHATVYNSKVFQANIIELVIDEAHCISEWGTDDFRPDFSKIAGIRARLPSGLPILVASATLPHDIILDIKHKLRLPDDCARVALSNAKPNVALSVRLLEHPEDTFADLLALIPQDATSSKDFPQTIFYTNGRQVSEKIQDFLRAHSPSSIPPESFEFYHRNIDEARKQQIQEKIDDGTLRGIPATDALGVGMDFRNIQRVVLWLEPRTFCSLVQKIGRCVRDAAQLGESILFVTKAFYKRHFIEADIVLDDAEDENEVDDLVDDGVDLDARDELIADDVQPTKKLRIRKKAMSALQARDWKYLVEYIITTGCRRIPWNAFFENETKLPMVLPPLPPGARCCDNCTPELFPVETILLGDDEQLKSGRRAKSSKEVYMAVHAALVTLRDEIVERDWPGQHFITGKSILQDSTIDHLASRAYSITSVDSIAKATRWHWSFRYGPEVVAVITAMLVEYPDATQVSREEEEARKLQCAAEREAQKDLRLRLTAVFDACHEAILSAVRIDHRKREVKKCQLFLRLPKKSTYPDYYELISQPISIAHIARFAHSNHYLSIKEYASDWFLLFDNARQYNVPESQIVEDANDLQCMVEQRLHSLSAMYGIPGLEPLAADSTLPPF